MFNPFDPVIPQFYMSAYGSAVKNGFTGTEQEWLESLKVKGDPGKSAYEYALAGGFKGTEEDFAIKMASEGKSAYEYAREWGYPGTEEDFGIQLATPPVFDVAGVKPGPKGSVPLEPKDIHALDKKGDTMEGQLLLPDPESEKAAVPRSYADKMLPKSGGSMTGPINMGSQGLSGLKDPVDHADAAHKGFVEKTVAARILIFENKSVEPESFTEDSGKKEFPFQALIPCAGVTADHVPYVTYDDDDALSGIFGPTAKTVKEGVYIYAAEKPGAAVTIPTIQAVMR